MEKESECNRDWQSPGAGTGHLREIDQMNEVYPDPKLLSQDPAWERREDATERSEIDEMIKQNKGLGRLAGECGAKILRPLFDFEDERDRSQ